MSEYRISGDFELSADALWAVIRNFGDVSWLPGKPKVETKGQGVGMTRTIGIPPLPTVTEQLDAIDEAGRAIHYRVTEGNPMPVCDYRASMRVVDLGGGRSQLAWSSVWEPDGVTEEQARTAVGQLYAGILAALKRNLERRSRLASGEQGGEAVKRKVPAFDPEKSWAVLDARIECEADPRRRQVLTQVRDHMRTEIRGELPALMATLVDEPRYHLWGVPVEGGPKGRRAVEEFYRQMISAGGNKFQFDIRRIVVDADAVVTEGRMRQKLPGTAVRASGVEKVGGEPVDPHATYLAETQILTVWPMSADGRIEGEDIYFGSMPMQRLTRL